MSLAIGAFGISRVFRDADVEITALDRLDLEVEPGEAIAVTGPSGSGKTTLLNLIAGLDRPTTGSVTVFDERVDQMSDSEQAAFRARTVGLVFQEPHLFPGLTALENVTLARLPWEHGRGVAERARDLLDAAGLSHRVNHPPSRMSGGERQRVGIARALIGQPRLLLADEPTGNLDSRTAAGILELLGSLRREHELTLVLVTHDVFVAAMADRVVHLNGQLPADTPDDLDRK